MLFYDSVYSVFGTDNYHLFFNDHPLQAVRMAVGIVETVDMDPSDAHQSNPKIDNGLPVSSELLSSSDGCLSVNEPPVFASLRTVLSQASESDHDDEEEDGDGPAALTAPDPDGNTLCTAAERSTSFPLSSGLKSKAAMRRAKSASVTKQAWA